jgi:hypothetical protein
VKEEEEEFKKKEDKLRKNAGTLFYDMDELCVFRNVLTEQKFFFFF